MLESVSCVACGSSLYTLKLTKKSRLGESFDLVECNECRHKFVSPRPDEKSIAVYYQSDYFEFRDDRGYDDYFSEKTKSEISRIFHLNLKDLNFKRFKSKSRNSLDIGCAAGYFVEYMKSLGWDAHGIDLCRNCIDVGRSHGLNLLCADYLSTEYNKKFNLITMWTTIEHLHRPEDFLKKICSDLDDNGILYISTCRADGISFMKLFGSKWRFYNFPEHLNFFSIKNIKKFLNQNGFKVKKTIMYGSGVGSTNSLKKRAADFAAKYFRLGDMMLICAVKNTNKDNI